MLREEFEKKIKESRLTNFYFEGRMISYFPCMEGSRELENVCVVEKKREGYRYVIIGECGKRIKESATCANEEDIYSTLYEDIKKFSIERNAENIAFFRRICECFISCLFCKSLFSC